MFFRKKKSLVLTKHKIEQHSVLTCPACGHKRIAAMPTPAASFRYQCSKCETVHKPVECCVFCSFGSVGCPEKQTAGSFPARLLGERCLCWDNGRIVWAVRRM